MRFGIGERLFEGDPDAQGSAGEEVQSAEQKEKGSGERKESKRPRFKSAKIGSFSEVESEDLQRSRLEIGVEWELEGDAGQTSKSRRRFEIMLRHYIGKAPNQIDVRQRIAEAEAKWKAKTGKAEATDEDYKKEIFLEMLKDNGQILRPRHVRVGTMEDDRYALVYEMDHTVQSYPFDEALNIVEHLAQNRQWVSPNVGVHYAKMKSGELRALRGKNRDRSGKDEYERAMEVRKGIGDIPGWAVELLSKVGIEGMKKYPEYKMKEAQGTTLLREESEVVAAFEKIAFNHRRRELTLNEAEINRSYTNRLMGERPHRKREHVRQVKEQQMVFGAQELRRQTAVRNTAKYPSYEDLEGELNRRVQKKLDDEKVPAKDRDKKAEEYAFGYYFNTVSAFGHEADMQRVHEELQNFGLVKLYTPLERNKVATKIAYEWAAQERKRGNFREPIDQPKVRVRQKITEQREGSQPAIIAERLVQKEKKTKKVVQEYAGVRIRLPKFPGKPEKQFAVPFNDTRFLKGVEEAKQFRDAVSAIFANKENYLPEVDIAPGGTDADPVFVFKLGDSKAEFRLSQLKEVLSLTKRVEAELFAPVYAESKKAKAEKRVQDWLQEAGSKAGAYKKVIGQMQHILANAGMPSITEQLIARELLTRADSPYSNPDSEAHKQNVKMLERPIALRPAYRIRRLSKEAPQQGQPQRRGVVREGGAESAHKLEQAYASIKSVLEKHNLTASTLESAAKMAEVSIAEIAEFALEKMGHKEQLNAARQQLQDLRVPFSEDALAAKVLVSVQEHRKAKETVGLPKDETERAKMLAIREEIKIKGKASGVYYNPYTTLLYLRDSMPVRRISLEKPAKADVETVLPPEIGIDNAKEVGSYKKALEQLVDNNAQKLYPRYEKTNGDYAFWMGGGIKPAPDLMLKVPVGEIEQAISFDEGEDRTIDKNVLLGKKNKGEFKDSSEDKKREQMLNRLIGQSKLKPEGPNIQEQVLALTFAAKAREIYKAKLEKETAKKPVKAKAKEPAKKPVVKKSVAKSSPKNSKKK